ncbi:GNAT family N-acetyltransferase [Frondihabitans australicus]|uniref:RimJ/RimL family protein N-acetyltransferase n=1 Tax=Frondihabitans australicus TaxID=386892 RepID=A0A495IJY8_9MICO|nr:GNAT family protein [Frondihabitans australicus]RKR76277.1 RimJ/RimL family protein N-acetyltransferase [Frondihabitans australicus]
MPVTLRAVLATDLPALSQYRLDAAKETGFEFFGFTAANALERRFAQDGLISDAMGTLAVIDHEGALAGSVGWFAVQHGPSTSARALNVGIGLLPDSRGRGIGTAAQRLLAEYLFENTLIERLEAATDVENVAEQRSLEKSGFTREGVMRHAQYRAGSWHDIVLYSRLRGDVAPA